MIEVFVADPALSVLCLGAHPDDIEIACGGTLLALSSRPGIRFDWLVLSGSSERVAESRSAAAELTEGRANLTFLDHTDGMFPAEWHRAKRALEEFAGDIHPDLVLAPRGDDSHQDHRMLGRLASTVWRDALILHYEIPKWDGDLRPVNHLVPLTRGQAERKVEVLNRCFPSQRDRDWWDDLTFLGLMRLRGVECRAPFAEGFVAAKVRLRLDGQ